MDTVQRHRHTTLATTLRWSLLVTAAVALVAAVLPGGTTLAAWSDSGVISGNRLGTVDADPGAWTIDGVDVEVGEPSTPVRRTDEIGENSPMAEHADATPDPDPASTGPSDDDAPHRGPEVDDRVEPDASANVVERAATTP